MKIFCTGNSKKKHFYDSLSIISEIANKYGHSIYLNSNLYKKGLEIKKAAFNNLKKKKSPFDLIISIGGDGALLQAIRDMGNNQKPVLGVHIGDLGFLNQINNKELVACLDNFFTLNSIPFNEYSLLSAKVEYKDRSKNFNLTALKPVVVFK